MKKKPVIGVCPLWDCERNSYWMLPGYMEGIMQAGGVPIMLPFAEDMESIDVFMEICDGFLFTGGQDVSPEIYGQQKRFDNVECCHKRDALEYKILEKALQLDIPILGICRGIQFINAALGGTLYQDLPTEIKSDLEHHQKPPYHIPVHDVKIEKKSPLYDLLECETFAVNSYHHQAVKELSPQLQSMATAADGVIESVYMPDQRFVWAFQWHPEFSFLTDENSRRIFEAFVKSAQ